ncbi:MAG: hypothetical protein P4L84_34945 [Isosphaeraceae bacterium]|nr:hypothetical protein [Isosphaeraceae bacterium]
MTTLTDRKTPVETTNGTLDDAPRLRQGVPAGPKPRPRPTQTGVHVDPHEEAALFDVPYASDNEETELPDVGPDGFPEWYDSYDRYQARMSLWLNGRGPRPE